MTDSINLTEPDFDESEMALLRECLESKWVTQGPLTERFEKLVGDACGARHTLATTSCTAALHLAAMALELGPGDEVIVPAFTWVTSAYSAEYVGAKVVFADIDPATFNIDPEALAAAITPRTRAIVAVHLFGLAAPMKEIMALARKHDIAVIEDAACAIGTTYDGAPVGTIGDIGCFSFHPRKVVTTGEGGAVTTQDDELATAVRSLRNHGATGLAPPTGEPHGPWSMSTFKRVGYNLRLSDIQAAVGIAQMAKLPHLLADRRKRADRYQSALKGLNDIRLPSTAPGHTYQSFVITVTAGGRSRRNQIMSYLAESGINTRPGTHAVHRLDYYRNRNAGSVDLFPHATAAENETITLPILPGMSDETQDRVIDRLREALKQ